MMMTGIFAQPLDPKEKQTRLTEDIGKDIQDRCGLYETVCLAKAAGVEHLTARRSAAGWKQICTTGERTDVATYRVPFHENKDIP